jgi:hypothetical protein
MNTTSPIFEVPYATNRHLGPFALVQRMEFMGIFFGTNVPAEMYPHEQYLQSTGARAVNEYGFVTPIFILNRLCLN